EGFIAKDERARLPLSVFWTHLSGSGHALVQVLVLSVILQAFVLIAPFYMQLTIDEVIARGDVDLLLVLALGFALLVLIKVATTAVRSVIILVIQNVLQFHLGARLFHHLIRLPLSFFEKRHIGDVLSRFSSLQPIRNLLAEGLIAALLDGVMAAITLVMIFVYSPLLAFVVLTAFFLYANASAGSLSGDLATNRGDHPGTGSGELHLYRERTRDTNLENFQPRGRARGAVAEPLQRCRKRECSVGPGQDRFQHDQRRYFRPGEHHHGLSGCKTCARQCTHGRHDLRVHELQAEFHGKGRPAHREGDRLPHSGPALGAPLRYRADADRGGTHATDCIHSRDPGPH